MRAHLSIRLLLVTALTVTGLAGLSGVAAAAPDSTSRISVGDSEQQANEVSLDPAVSRDGRYVVFTSLATNLTGQDTGGRMNVFLRDRTAQSTTLVSRGIGGSVADGDSTGADVSADGRYVAFTSDATNLVAGDTNGVSDVFVRDLQAGTTTRVSVSAGGAQLDRASGHPAIDDAGQHVLFETLAAAVPADTNGESDVFVRDLAQSSTRLASIGADGAPTPGGAFGGVISGDGSTVAFVQRDVYSSVAVADYDVPSDSSRTLSGTQFDAVGVDSLSTDGRFVGIDTLTSQARGYSCAAVVLDTSSGTSRVVATQDNRECYEHVSVSDDGATVTYSHDGVFLLRDGRTERVDLTPAGAAPEAYGNQPALSGDGTFITFASFAATLVSGDTNGVVDVFGFQVPPIDVRVVAPGSGAAVRGVVTVAAMAVPDSGSAASVTRVQFYRDGNLLGDGVRDPATPGRWTISWDASQFFGVHRLGARATDSAGHEVSSYPVSVQVTGSSSLTESVSPSAVTFGSPVTVSGKLTRVDGAGVAGERVEVQFKGVGQPLSTVAVATTGPDGSVSAAVSPQSSGSFVLYHPYSTAYAGSYSGFHEVSVATRVSASLDPVRASAGTRPVVSGTVAPAHAGATVELQQRKDMAWATVGSATLDSTGGYALRTPVTGSGGFHFRVLKPADADHTTGTSLEVVFTAYRVGISYIRADPPGDDATHLNGEWATLTNTGKVTVHLKGWRLSQGTRSYTLPYYNLGAGAKVRVHTGSGPARVGHIYLGSSTPLWPNSDGTATLYDPHGVVASARTYG